MFASFGFDRKKIRASKVFNTYLIKIFSFLNCFKAESDKNQDRPLDQLENGPEPILNDKLKVQESKTIHNEPEIEDLVTEHDKQLHENVHDEPQSHTAESVTFNSTKLDQNRIESTQSNQPTSANESQNSHDESSNNLRNDATSNTSVEKADKLIENEPSKPDNIAQTNEQSLENDNKTVSNRECEKQPTEPTQTTPQIDHADQNGIYDDNNNNIQKVTIEEPKPNRTNTAGKKASKRDKNKQNQPPKQHQQPVEQPKKVNDQRHESTEQQTPTNEAQKVTKEAEKIENKPITVEENTSKTVESSVENSKNEPDQPTTTNQSSKSNKNKAKSNNSNKISKKSVTKEADAENKPTPPAATANTAPVAEIDTKQANTSSELLSNKPIIESQQPKTDQTSAQTKTDNKSKQFSHSNYKYI